MLQSVTNHFFKFIMTVSLLSFVLSKPMKEIILNGKKYKLRATVGAVRSILKKYDMKKISDENDNESMLDFVIEMAWLFIVGWKPFFTFNRFKNKIDISDIRNAQGTLFSMLYGVEPSEDKESKNEKA